MQSYERARLTVIALDEEDIIATSLAPDDPNRNIIMDSPNYQSGSSDNIFGWNWTLWQ